MADVRVILREGNEKRYHNVTAEIHTPERTLRVLRNQDSIAEFQSEYYQYWEYVEETADDSEKDPQIDTSVSG
jgi:hypothetical protein